MPRLCRMPLAWLLAGLVIAGAPAAGEPLPEPGPDLSLPAPLYVPDPAGPGFAGLPPGIAAGIVPDWPRWFAGAGGLVMTRTLPGGAATMQPLGGTQLTTADADATWPGGVDLHVGRWFGDRQRHAVEFIYWGVYGLGGSAATTATPPAIVAIPQAPGVTIGGLPAAASLAGAAGQQVGRSDVINDVEINWLYAPGGRPEFQPRQQPLSLIWLAGFRFFQVADTLTLTSLPGNPALSPALLSVATSNSIFGAQMGAKFDWRFLPTVRFDVVPKVMIGGNSITDTTSLANAAGTQAVFAGGGPVSVHSQLGVFSWLGSVDTGIAWDVTDRWTLSLGYRVVGVGAIAQADGQWPTTIITPASLAGIEAGSSTIIHGGFAGFEARY